jgi:hypothetical protein
VIAGGCGVRRGAVELRIVNDWPDEGDIVGYFFPWWVIEHEMCSYSPVANIVPLKAGIEPIAKKNATRV